LWKEYLVTQSSSGSDAEFVMLAQTLERLAVRVEAAFDPEMDERGCPEPDTESLLNYVEHCKQLLDSQPIALRLDRARV